MATNILSLRLNRQVLKEQWLRFLEVAGTISGSAIGYAHGNGWLSSSYVYWFCAIINVLVGVFGCVALSGQRNHREIFADTSALTKCHV